MKKVFFLMLTCFISLTLLSWGVIGHQAVGLIAERHLSSKTKAGVQTLLGNLTLSEVSTWADEIENDPKYKSTSSWHYINLPGRLNRNQFDQEVTTMTQPNIYQALNNEIGILKDTSSTKDQKVEALKFIVHLVGDAHQPMHVSQADNQGGNKIQLNYDREGTNLHALWDNKLIEHSGWSAVQIASNVDKVNPETNKNRQDATILDWLWESYYMSGRIYKYIEALKSRNLTNDYYTYYRGFVQTRLHEAGIRLAGLLNSLFENTSIAPEGTAPSTTNAITSPRQTVKEIDIHSLNQHIGEYVLVCDKVYGAKAIGSNLLLDIGAAYAKQVLTVVFKIAPKGLVNRIKGQRVCVEGTLENYKDKPKIVVSDPKALTTYQ